MLVSGLSDQLRGLLVLSERAVSTALVQSELLVWVVFERLGRDDRPLVRVPTIRHLAGWSFLLLLWLLRISVRMGMSVTLSGFHQFVVPGPQLCC